jgi:hypothetical protein
MRNTAVIIISVLLLFVGSAMAEPNNAEMARRIRLLEAQMNQANGIIGSLVRGKTQTQVQVITGTPASTPQASGGTGTGTSVSQVNEIVAAGLSSGAIGALATQSTAILSCPGVTITVGGVAELNVVFNGIFTLYNPTTDSTITFNGSATGGLQIYPTVNIGVANGIDTGTFAENSVYYVYAIYDTDAEVLAGLISLSPTSPVLPSGGGEPGNYTYQGLLGAVITQSSSAAFIPSIQQGNDLFLTTRQQISISAHSSWTALNIPIPLPSMTGDIILCLSGGTAGALAISLDNSTEWIRAQANMTMQILAPNQTLLYTAPSGTDGTIYIQGLRLNL